MEKRVTAFDDLLGSFASGTRENTIDKYVVTETKSRLGEYPYPFFCLSLTAPDGSGRGITMKDDRVY